MMDGAQMYPLVLSGDTEKHTPLWTFIGTDGCGNIVGSTEGSPVPIRVCYLLWAQGRRDLRAAPPRGKCNPA